MRQIPTSPFPRAGETPSPKPSPPTIRTSTSSTRTTTPSFSSSSATTENSIAQNTVNTPGVFPMGVAVSGQHLFVVDTYQPLPTCSAASPCSGSIAVFPHQQCRTDPRSQHTGPVVNPDISTTYWPLTLPGSPTNIIVPTAINVTGSGSLLYVSAYDATSGGGYVFGFSVNSDGSLAALNNGVPFPVGTHPSALASDSAGGLSLRDRFAQERCLRLPDQLRPPHPIERKPLCHRNRACLHRNRLDLKIRLHRQRTGLQHHRLHHQCGQPEPVGVYTPRDDPLQSESIRH